MPTLHNKLTPRRLRLLLQSGFALFLVWTCYHFIMHVRWALGGADAWVAKPASVEGFLPISALVAAKRLAFTGAWDPVHPAGLTIFLALCGGAFLFRKGFCGHLCPIGFTSALLERAGRALGVSRQPTKLAGRILAAPKYLLLASFFYLIVWDMPVAAIENFLRSPYNMVADTKMLFFFLEPSTTTLVAVAVLAVLSLVMPSFWCRVLCPYGALLGLLAHVGPTAIARDAATCTGCRRCTRACPAALQVHSLTRVTSPECLGCTHCVDACPETACLGVRFAGKRVSHWVIGVGALAVIVAAWAVATSLGQWESPLPPAMVQRMHMLLMQGGISH